MLLEKNEKLKELDSVYIFILQILKKIRIKWHIKLNLEIRLKNRRGSSLVGLNQLISFKLQYW